MTLLDRVKQAFRPTATAATGTKSSAAGPMIAWSGVGQPRWTPRNLQNLAEEGFRKNVIANRCVMAIATAGASVPWLLYDDAGHELERHPLLDLLRHPNPMQDGVSFMESVYAYLEIAGNAYIEAVTPNGDEADAPIELYVLRPDRMRVIPGSNGLPMGYQYTVNNQVTSWPADPVSGCSRILHLKRFHPLDDWYGLAPMEAALVSIDQHNAAGAWNQALLSQGARPSGALVYAPKDGPATLSDEQMNRLREELAQLYQGSRNAGRPMVLEGGLDWREMSLSPKDMDWLAGRDAAARDIALAFGVPSQLVGIAGSQTYANMAEARLAFYEETVLPVVTRVVAGIDHWLTPKFADNLQLDFNTDAISALAARREALWTRARTADFLTRAERRAMVGYEDAIAEDNSDALAEISSSGMEKGRYGNKANTFDFIQRIRRGSTLFVGEGNLSFALSLVESAGIQAYSITATTLEDAQDLSEEAARNAKRLRLAGATVVNGVDAMNLSSVFAATYFNTIVFQFPHTGSRESIAGRNSNFILIREFLKSAAQHLSKNGVVIISTADTPHYRGAFQFEEAAHEAGFATPRSYPFDPEKFPGYHHTMSHQNDDALASHDRFATWVFAL